MTLRRKASNILILTFIGLVAGLYVCSRAIISDAFAGQEVTETRQDVQRVLSAVDDDTAEMAGTTKDWATWDDTYAFIQNHNDHYISSNTTDTAFTNNRIDVMVYLDTSGHAVFSRAYNFRKGKSTAVPPDFLRLSADSPLVLRPDNRVGITDLVFLPQGPMMVAAEPILTSQGEGPARGTLIFGRYLDVGDIQRLSRADITSLTAQRVASDQPSGATFEETMRLLRGGQGIVVQPIDSKTIVGYVVIPDISGKQGLMLRAALPRVVYQKGEAATIYSIIVSIIVVCVFAGVTAILFESQIFSRLNALGRSVSKLAAKGDSRARITIPGKDELNDLAGDINNMLDALEQAEMERREDQDRYRAVVEQASEAIFLFDIDMGRIVEANASTLHMLGYTLEEILDLTIYDVVAHERESVNANTKLALETGRAAIGERNYRRKDGALVDVEVSATLISVSGNRALCVMARDITERKQASEAVSRERNFALQVMNTMGQGLAVTDANTQFTFVNSALARMLGYSAEELLGKCATDVIFPEDRDRVVRAVAQRLKGKTETYELRLRRADGSGVHSLVTGAPHWENGTSVGSITVFTDLTERKRSEVVLRRQNQELAALHETALSMINRLEPDDLLQTVLARAASLADTHHAYLYVVDPLDSEHLVIRAGLGVFATQVGYQLRKGEGLAGKVWEIGQSLVVDDYSLWTSRRLDLDYMKIHAILGIPLRASDEIVGVIGLAHVDRGRLIDLDDLTLLERFAYLASLALENARLYTASKQELTERKKAEEALHELAIRDELTGLYNRREMGRLLSEEVTRCRRYERALSLVMLDLDYFKQVNDTYGHPVGDDVLRWLVQLLKDNVRAADRLARYGGEEFAVIMPETDLAEACETAERLRRIVDESPFVFARSGGDVVEIHLTISVGVASIASHSAEEAGLIRAADRALYKAKRAGRNRVETAHTATISDLAIV